MPKTGQKGSGVRLFGDWKKLPLVSAFLDALPSSLTDETKHVADMILKALREHIDSQDLPWEPLKASTLQRKRNTAVRGPETIYIDREDFRNSLEVRIERSAFTLRVVIGPKEAEHPDSGIDYRALAKYLEQGTSRMAARPLFEPTLEEMKNTPEFKRVSRFKFMRRPF